MSLISVNNLTFSYDGSYDNIFENISFKIDTDWKLGFTGRNGRGKTTFLKLLMKEFEFTGSIISSVEFEYFPYEIKDKKRNTIDIIDSILVDYELWMLIKELNLLEVCDDALYRPFETLSNGEQTKILLAVLFLKENSFLLIDEPTNHLDVSARKIVGDYLNSKKGFILVSHDRNFMDTCIDHIMAINRTNIEIQKGNFSTWWRNKNLRDNYEIEENEKLKKEIKTLEESARRTKEWSDKVERTKFGTGDSGLKPDRGYVGHKSAKMMKRSKVSENRKYEAIEAKEQLLKNIEKNDKLKLNSLKYTKKNLVELKDVSIFYNDKIVCNNINFDISCGDRIALRGKNGSGKSSIIKLICGENINYTGEFRCGSGVNISYIPQDTSHLKGKLKDYSIRNNIDESLFKAILRKLDFSRIQFEKNIEEFSQGQKKKVLIARSLCEQAHLYIWDEPLNYIDVLSRIQIEQLLIEFKPTLLFVEHDTAFSDSIATSIVNLD